MANWVAGPLEQRWASFGSSIRLDLAARLRASIEHYISDMSHADRTEILRRCDKYAADHRRTTMTTDTANAIESLRAFAVAHNELQFAHLCTAALSGEESEQWAMTRLEAPLRVWAVARTMPPVTIMVDVIRSTDTTRPDGAVARKMSAPV